MRARAPYQPKTRGLRSHTVRHHSVEYNDMIHLKPRQPVESSNFAKACYHSEGMLEKVEQNHLVEPNGMVYEYWFSRHPFTLIIKITVQTGDFQEDTVVFILETTAADGKSYLTAFYNLDAIIAVGYRVNIFDKAVKKLNPRKNEPES